MPKEKREIGLPIRCSNHVKISQVDIVITYLVKFYTLESRISDLRWPQLAEAWRGTWVSSQRLRLDCGGESPRFLATRTAVSDKGPGPSAWQKRIPSKTVSGETNKVFTKRGKKVQSCG